MGSNKRNNKGINEEVVENDNTGIIRERSRGVFRER